MKILMNASCVFPVSDVMWETPLRIFSTVYEQSGSIDDVLFADWLHTYLLPPNITEDEEQQHVIEATLSDNSLLQRAVLSLFPIQYDAIEQNWPAMQKDLKKLVYYKRSRDVQIKSYAHHMDLFEKAIDTIMLL